MAQSLLVIDDDIHFCDTIEFFFENTPIRIIKAVTGQEGLEVFRQTRVEVVLLDEHLPDTKGTSLCEKLLKVNEHAKIIFVTGSPTIDHVVKVLRQGAYDYLSKPMSYDEVHLAVNRAMDASHHAWSDEIFQVKEKKESEQEEIIGLQGGLRSISWLIEQAGSSDATVLLTGETGVGKSAIAKKIHSMREDDLRTFINTNCAAIPENLIEAELFGHVKGAFTGATSSSKGLFELANGGTLFLDEIGELPFNMQSKLLGVLDDGTYKQVGGNVYKKTNTRIITATNIDLEDAINNKKFRSDLYYRLNVLQIHIPPLRERLEDLEEICSKFLKIIEPSQDVYISRSEMAILHSYRWPGNIRELRNVLERSVILRTSSRITPSQFLQFHTGSTHPVKEDFFSTSTISSLEKLQQQYIQTVLKYVSNNQTLAAKTLGISRATLIRKLSKFSCNDQAK